MEIYLIRHGQCCDAGLDNYDEEKKTTIQSLMLTDMKEKHDADRVTIQSGGILNGAFLREDLLILLI